jgi:tungstate transport system ATP-binding protein
MELPEMAVLVELKNITKYFNNKKVLDNINLEIKEGEILALLGPNGSGKSTLLKILALLLNPDSGEIEFQNSNVTGKNLELLRLQSTMVFQKTLLFNSSVFDNVAYGLKMRKMHKAKIIEEVQRALKLVKLEGFEKRQAKKLSGGEQQRVSMARALVLKAKLLLLDEPTANLDPKNVEIIEEVIASVNKLLKTTVVMATHNMFQAKSLPTRIALINEGRITEVGSPAEVFGNLSRNLASFAAMDNTFSGTAKNSGEGTSLIDLGNGIVVEAVTDRSGDIRLFISPHDIILSKTPLVSSARNALKGKIYSIDDQDPLVRLTVDAGKIFTVQITKKSFEEMNLNLGAEVFITFKASSVQIL